MLPLPSLPLPLWLAYACTLGGAVVMVGGVTLARKQGWTTPIVGRKVMHILTGPVFVLCWLLFPSSPSSPWLAASVPLLMSLYMLLCSRGAVINSPLVQTISRTGARGELGAGPFYYGVIHALAAVAYWRDSPTGLVSLLTLCVGDGVADLFGRRYGRTRWWHNRDKSVEGTLAFVLGALLACTGMILALQGGGYLPFIHWAAFRTQLAWVVLGAALVESLPLGQYDNIGVFVAVAGMAHWMGW